MLLAGNRISHGLAPWSLGFLATQLTDSSYEGSPRLALGRIQVSGLNTGSLSFALQALSVRPSLVIFSFSLTLLDQLNFRNGFFRG